MLYHLSKYSHIAVNSDSLAFCLCVDTVTRELWIKLWLQSVFPHSPVAPEECLLLRLLDNVCSLCFQLSFEVNCPLNLWENTLAPELLADNFTPRCRFSIRMAGMWLLCAECLDFCEEQQISWENGKWGDMLPSSICTFP